MKKRAKIFEAELSVKRLLYNIVSVRHTCKLKKQREVKVMNKRKFASAGLVLSVLALLTVGIIMSAGCSRKPANKGEILIGAVAPTTGTYAEMGNDLLNAVKMAVDEKNAAGGIDGRKIRLIIEDDKGSPKDAVSVAQKITGNSSIIGVIGHLNSGTTLPASTVYSDGGLALIMPVPTNPAITTQGLKNLFRIPITDDKQGPAIISFAIDKMHKKNFAIIHNKDAYGEGIATEAKKELERRGMSPVVFDSVNANDQDFKPVISKLINASNTPDAVFFGGGYAEAALFIKQSRQLGLNATFFMGDGCFDSQLIQIAGASAEGAFISNIAPVTAPTKEAKVFYDKYNEKYGKIVAFAPLGYVAANILLDAIEKSKDKTREGVLKVLQAPSYSYNSILGEFSFNKNGDSKGQKVFFHEVKNGKFVTF